MTACQKRSPSAGPSDPVVIAAPHCEFGCAATALSRHGIDLVRDVIGAEWSFEVATRRLSTVPQPFLDRTDVAFTAQGRGWREIASETAGVNIADHVADQTPYLAEVLGALGRGGVIVLVDDSKVPWLSHAAWSHGLLPHTLAIWTADEAARVTRVIEGHSWWQGVYTMTYDDMLAAAFPEEDVHGVAGRYLAFDVSPVPPEQERVRRALNRLLVSARQSVAGGIDSAVTRHGTVSVAVGPTAAHLAIEAFGGLRYVCRLAERSDRSPEMIRDMEFGRYTFERLSEEFAFAAYARTATGRLLEEGMGVTGAVCRAVKETAEAWRTLWRSARDLTTQLSSVRLDDMLRRWRVAADADRRTAVRVVQFLERGMVVG